MKTAQLQIRLTPAQKALLKQRARAAGQDVSEYVLSRVAPESAVGFERAVAALRDAALEAFDRYPQPKALAPQYWAEQRDALSARVAAMTSRPPKFVKDIPVPFADVFFNNMPIHERLRSEDFELIRNQLRVNLLSMYRDFTKRADLPALAAALPHSADEPAT